MITWEDLHKIRETMGKSINEMAKDCGIEDAGFLLMLESGKIRTTSSAIMACISRGYHVDKRECVEMVAHWSPSWPKESFGAGERMIKGINCGKIGKISKKMQKETIDYRPWVIQDRLNEMGKSVGCAAYETGISERMMRIYASGSAKRISIKTVMRLCAYLGMEPWELSPDIAKGEETDERAGGAAGKEKDDRSAAGRGENQAGEDAANDARDGDGGRGARAGARANGRDDSGD